MPNIKGALKRVHTSAEDRMRNRSVKSAILTQRRVFLAALDAKDKEKAAAECRKYVSVLDKAAKKGIIKKNNADRKKGRAVKHLAALQKAPAPAADKAST